MLTSIGAGSQTTRPRGLRSERSFAKALLWSSLASLVVGFVYYATCRSHVPYLLSFVPAYHGASRPIPLPPIAYSLPSLLHAYAFTCLLGVCWGAGSVALLLSGSFWFVANLMWELVCVPHGTVVGAIPAIVSYAVGPNTCTYDSWDIAASAIGAAAPLAARLLVMNFARNSSAT